jgi:hypothetical protein
LYKRIKVSHELSSRPSSTCEPQKSESTLRNASPGVRGLFVDFSLDFGVADVDARYK